MSRSRVSPELVIVLAKRRAPSSILLSSSKDVGSDRFARALACTPSSARRSGWLFILTVVMALPGIAGLLSLFGVFGFLLAPLLIRARPTSAFGSFALARRVP